MTADPAMVDAAESRPMPAEVRAFAPLRLDVAATDRAADEWRFNCGPAAICAIRDLSPEQVRPHMGDFESKGYTNPTLMFAALRSLGVSWTNAMPNWPRWGLVRVQWGGPWTRDGVPIRARYRHTHWVGSSRSAFGDWVFDVNATCSGGWISFNEWSERLVPWLLRECVPRADGKWWITHSLEVEA
jgi:hypothetical protein